MENLIKFLEEKITDKMPVEGIVDVFEQICSTPLEEDMVLFETGTFTDFSKEPFFQISLVRQFSNDDEEFYQIHVTSCMSQPLKIKFSAKQHGTKI